MLRPSLPEILQATTPDQHPVDGATDVIEAGSAEAAIAAVHERLGPDARIVEARRERRGGIGGFFAKEVVQLHAAPAADEFDPAPADPSSSVRLTLSPVAASTDGSPVDRLLHAAADAPDTVDFATFLRAQMGHGEVTEGRAPANTSALDAALASAKSAPATPAGPISVADLRAAAGAYGAIDHALEQELASDAALAATGASAAEAATPVRWPVADPDEAGERPKAPITYYSPLDELTSAFADAPIVPDVFPDLAREASPEATPGAATPEATNPVVAPEPAVPGAAHDLVDGPAWSSQALLHLGLPIELVRAVDLDPSEDDLAWTTALATNLIAACGPIPEGQALVVGPRADHLGETVDSPTARSRMWFDALRDGRWLHLVVGGEGWRDHLDSGPLVVSWTREEDLPDALRCALELGLTLGYGPMGGVVRRARPLDVALAIRTLVDAR